jgi:hypothetical protein
LFHDDFENTSAVSRANYPDDSGNYNPVGANPGSWTINENNPNAVQVTASSTSPDPGAFQGTKCLRLRRAVDGKDIASAEAHFAEQSAPGERLRISAMVYVPAVEQDTDVAMQVTLGNADDYINLIANFDGHRSVVSHARHGALHDTGVNFTAGRWQKWEIEYAIGRNVCTADRRPAGDGNSRQSRPSRRSCDLLGPFQRWHAHLRRRRSGGACRGQPDGPPR